MNPERFVSIRDLSGMRKMDIKKPMINFIFPMKTGIGKPLGIPVVMVNLKLFREVKLRWDSLFVQGFGFSSAPGLIRVLGIIPGLQGFVFPIAGIWMLVAMVIAVRQALDYSSTLRAVGVCLIGWVIQILLFVLLFSMVGGFPAAQ